MTTSFSLVPDAQRSLIDKVIREVLKVQVINPYAIKREQSVARDEYLHEM